MLVENCSSQVSRELLSDRRHYSDCEPERALDRCYKTPLQEQWPVFFIGITESTASRTPFGESL
jgi:hypothetical protein